MWLIKTPLYAMVNIAFKYACKYEVISTHHSCVVRKLKVSLIFAFFVWPWFQEVGRLAKVIIVEFSFETALCSFREHALSSRIESIPNGCKQCKRDVTARVA